MYARLISGMLRGAPKRVIYNGQTVFNPPQNILIESGYFPVAYTDAPTDAPEGRHYEPHWEQNETEIRQVWTLADDPVDTEPEPTMSELLKAIERGMTV